jgi:hypothetical protein
VQVWDSGIGIAEAMLPRVFEEFFQVQGNRPLQAHQRKGLGLGLAIVKRLSDLMQTEVSVRSRAGHGTVFTLELPVGKAPRPLEAPAAGGRSPIGLTLEGRRFVVVEDEAAVREGLVVLLQAWGASVDAFETVEAVQAWVERVAARGAGPAARRLPAAARQHRPGGPGRAIAAIGRNAACRRSWSPAAAWAGTRTRRSRTTSTC